MNSKNKRIITIIGSVFIGLLLGALFFGGSGEATGKTTTVEEHAHDTIWTCSMHPEIQQDEPGKCPLCGMDLIPKEKETSTAHQEVVQLSDYAKKLAQVETVIIGGNTAQNKIELFGKVSADESRSNIQSAHISGRIEHLFVDVTGKEIQKGQALASVYSPELVVAQEELLQAFAIRESNPLLFEAAKDKLRNRNIDEEQIQKIIAQGKPMKNFTITADIGGVVTEKLIERGDHVENGTPMYQVVNLQKVWVLFEVYESEMKWINEGDKISFNVASLPGKTFEGKVTFISPTLDPKTRTAEARVEIVNTNGKLKPGMFATGTIKSEIENGDTKTVSVPKSAVLWTGKRSVLYVVQPDGSGYRLREVVLGASTGDRYLIEKGLKPGEEVVVNGAFTVDAAAQLAGKPSMMNRES